MRHHKQMRRSALVQTALAVLMSGSLVLFAVMATSIGLRPGARGGLRPVAPLGSTPGITLPATRAAQAAGDVSDNSSSSLTAAAPVGTPDIAAAPAPSNGLTALPRPAPSGDVTAPSETDETPSLGGGTAVALGDDNGGGSDGPPSRRGSLNVRRTEGPSPTPASTDEGGAIVDPDDAITTPSQEPASEDGSEAEPPKQVPNDQDLSDEKKNDSQKKAGPTKTGKKGQNGGKGKKGSKGAGKKSGGSSSSKGINESRSGPTSTKSTTARPTKSRSKPATSSPPPSKPAAKKNSGSSSEADGGRPHAAGGNEKKKIRRKN